MSNRPETIYREHLIYWSDNEEVWRCSDINFNHIKLAKVKEKIDALYLAMRKAAAVNCFYLDGYDEPRLKEATVIDYRGPIHGTKSVNFHSVKTDEIVDHSMVVMTQAVFSSEKKSRQTKHLSNLVPNTPEAMAKFDEARAIYHQIVTLKNYLSLAVRAIPRLTLDDVAGLVKAAETKIEED